ELFGGRRAHHAVEVVEDLGHQVPGRPGVEGEPVLLPGPCPAAEFAVLLENGHPMAVASEQTGGCKPTDTSADHDNTRRLHRTTFIPSAWAKIRALTGFGTRTRVCVRTETGAASMRSV